MCRVRTRSPGQCPREPPSPTPNSPFPVVSGRSGSLRKTLTTLTVRRTRDYDTEEVSSTSGLSNGPCLFTGVAAFVTDYVSGDGPVVNTGVSC